MAGSLEREHHGNVVGRANIVGQEFQFIMKPQLISGLLALFIALFVSGCNRPKSDDVVSPASQAQLAGGGSLAIVSGSENKSLEPIVQEFARRNGVKITITYMGSVEIGQELAKGTQCPFDAVWPAASLWIDLFDSAKATRSSESIMRTPVVFAVKKSVAQSLGWIGKDVRVMDILNAAERRQLRLP